MSIEFFTVAGVKVATMPLHEAEFRELEFMPILVIESDMFYFIYEILLYLTDM